MDEKELVHRVERSQLELEYWHSRADQMRSVLDVLETDYLTHRTECFLVRRRHLRAAIDRALDSMAALEGGSGGGVPDVMDDESSTSSEPSVLSDSASLLAAAAQSTATASDFSRNVRRLANRANLKSTYAAMFC